MMYPLDGSCFFGCDLNGPWWWSRGLKTSSCRDWTIF